MCPIVQIAYCVLANDFCSCRLVTSVPTCTVLTRIRVLSCCLILGTDIHRHEFRVVQHSLTLGMW